MGDKKKITSNRRLNLIDAITNYTEEKGDELSEWETGFLDSILMQLMDAKDLTHKQYDKLTDIIGIV